MRVALAIVALVAFGSTAFGQNIDIQNSVGPSGTHFDLELPCSGYTYTSYCDSTGSYRHLFRVFQNGIQKHSEVFDVINPVGTQTFVRYVDFTTWNLQVGDVIHFFSRVTILGTKTMDQDSLLGDCVNLIRCEPPSRGMPGIVDALAAIDDKRRFETLLA